MVVSDRSGVLKNAGVELARRDANEAAEMAIESLSPAACTTIEEVGSTGVGALTIVFLVLAVSTIVFIARSSSAKETKQYYFCSIYICAFSTLAYFAMLSGQGWTAVAGCRQFFYVRYVDYAITLPLIILQLGLIAGAETSIIAATIGAESEYFAYILLLICENQFSRASSSLIFLMHFLCSSLCRHFLLCLGVSGDHR